MKFKRLKIVEQIIIVLLFSVIVPLVISWVIINNINQQAVRHELKNSAVMAAKATQYSIETLSNSNANKLKEMSLAFKYMNKGINKDIYLNDILINSKSFKSLEILSPKDKKYPKVGIKNIRHNESDNTLILTEKLHNNDYLQGTVKIDAVEKAVFNIMKDDKRQVYILNENNDLILSHNYTEKDYLSTIEALPDKIETDNPVIFGNLKNQPLVYLKMSSPDLMIIVNTTAKITDNTINKARKRIFLAFVITGATIIFVVMLYTYYLYINIRQLFKGIKALSKGNYKRKVRLLTNVFTPFEMIFLASEFNRMVDEINASYRKLKQINRELKILDEFRANLIDTVSHEFRTPLTSIKGYASRLLRHDIEIDEATKVKSLKVIKNQVERLTNMVEDLLVIPDIEGANLNIKKEAVNILEIIETSILAVKKHEDGEFVIDAPAEISKIFADKDRLEQVIINIFENSLKYAYENTQINIKIAEQKDAVVMAVSNKADYIPKELLNRLFEKFVRVEDKTTRTTRGTGLGLYIVKGLVEAMGAHIKLHSGRDNTFCVIISFKKGKNE